MRKRIKYVTRKGVSTTVPAPKKPVKKQTKKSKESRDE